MWMNGAWGWFPFMWIFPLLFLVIFLVLVFRRGSLPMCGPHGMRERDASAREILDRRYASGEIGKEEYQRMRQDLLQ